MKHFDFESEQFDRGGEGLGSEGVSHTTFPVYKLHLHEQIYDRGIQILLDSFRGKKEHRIIP